MQCQKCNTEVSDDAAFCSQCGAAMKGTGDAGQESATSAADATPMEQLTGSSEAQDTGPEKTLWSGGFSGKAMVGTWMLCFFITVGAIAAAVFLGPIGWFWALGIIALVWIGSLLRLAYKKVSMRYELTNRKFLHKSGILVRNVDRIELFEIKDVTSRQGLIQSLFNVGSVFIISADQSHPELTLEGISDPEEVANLIDDTSRPVREKRTLIAS